MIVTPWRQMRTNTPLTIGHPCQPDRSQGPTLILILICGYIKISSNVYLFLFLLAITGPHWYSENVIFSNGPNSTSECVNLLRYLTT
jgi:hypothetical protein